MHRSQQKLQTTRSGFQRAVKKPLFGKILHSLTAWLCLLPIGAAAGSEPQPFAEQSAELFHLPIERLMDLEVTSVSRSRRKLSESATAIYVIIQEDIQRSGVTTIADALRMAPGMNVAQIDANKWAISARGFNDYFANKLLVLQDGRSVYNPLFSGVFWDVQDTLLEDIDRIEVIRGPGASLWGANAVNGVINIITKSSRDTQGGLIMGGGGTHEHGFGGVRYGGQISKDAYYRVYVKAFNRGDFDYPDGREAADEWHMVRTGFRTDWFRSKTDTFTFQGDYYEGEAGQSPIVFPPPTFYLPLEGEGRLRGGNLLGLWKHSFSETSESALQIYYDRTEREDLVHREIRDTYDLDFQHRFAIGERQELTWGLGYRRTQDDLEDGTAETGAFTFSSSRRGDDLFSAFLQDEIGIVPDRLRLTLGSKFEHNDYTGVEIQPSARLLWTPSEMHSLWGAVSRAVRTPARFEHTVRVWSIPPPASVIADDSLASEDVLAYELGYRFQPQEWLSFDLAGFYNKYDDLRSVAFSGMAPGSPVALYHFENEIDGETYGVELAVTFQATRSWKLLAGYSRLEMNIDPNPLQLPQLPDPEGDSPENQLFVRSYLDLPANVQFDTSIGYVDHLPSRDVPPYWRWDIRVGWRPRPNLDLSLVVQNILDDRHPEFGPSFLVTPTEIERSVYGKITWQF